MNQEQNLKFSRRVVSFFLWLFDKGKCLADFKKGVDWSLHEVLEESEKPDNPSGITFTAHVFYEDFASKLIEAIRDLPPNTNFLITTPFESIRQKLESKLNEYGFSYKIRLTPNIGRNFGPLLVEFSRELRNVESFIHVHSKRSSHSPQISEEWVERNINLLLRREGIQRAFDILTRYPKVGLVYADASDFLRGINFRWGRSRGVIKKHFSNIQGFELIEWSGRLTFPAGGMFWVKTNAIRPLLEVEWEYEMFPEETDQIDGTLQHGLERLIGELARSRGFVQACYLKGQDDFRINSKLQNQLRNGQRANNSWQQRPAKN